MLKKDIFEVLRNTQDKVFESFLGVSTLENMRAFLPTRIQELCGRLMSSLFNLSAVKGS